jgi:hypothetical protein
MALPLDYFAIDFQSNRDIPRCRRLLPYYRRRSSFAKPAKMAVYAGDADCLCVLRTAVFVR